MKNINKVKKEAKKCWANMSDLIQQKQTPTNPADTWTNQNTDLQVFKVEVAKKIGTNKATLANVQKTIQNCYEKGYTVTQTINFINKQNV
jgi:hypothetical protein